MNHSWQQEQQLWPRQPVRRYQVENVRSPHHVWRFNHKCRTLPAGKILRFEVLAPAIVHWSADEWQTVHDTGTRDTGFGIHVADLPTAGLSAGRVQFTFRWPLADRWEGADFAVAVVQAQAPGDPVAAAGRSASSQA